MSDVIGRGVIEVTADSTKLKAGIDDAKRSINGMGDAAEKASTRSSNAINKYIKDLQVQNATLNLSAREAEKYKLALRGATTEQLAAADAAHRMREANERGAQIGRAVGLGLAAIAAGAIASYVAFDKFVKKAGDFQDLAEKTGDSAQNIASLAVAAGTAGIEMKDVGGLAVKLSKNLVGVNDDSKAAGAAVKALGLNLASLKEMGAADRLETIGKALNGFSDSAAKGDIAVALLGKAGADALPFLKELGQEGGRQVILTNDQIAQADDYADKQARLRSEISLYAQAIATKMLPSVVDLTGAIKDSIAEMVGVGKSADALAKNESIANFADGVVLALAQVIDIGDGVFRIFDLIGTSVGRMGQAAKLVGHGQFAEASQFAKDSEDIYKKILDRPLLQTKVQARIADRKIAAFNKENGDSNYFETADTARAPKLKFNGAPDAAKKDSGEKLAVAQRALDLARIKADGEAQAGALTNAQRIMEGIRSAGLIDDKEYYAAKLGFIRLTSDAQESELQKEITRIEKEKLTGKNALDNEKKLVEAKSKLATLRAATATSIELNGIQEAAANTRVAQSYVDAARAAQLYIETIKRQAGRDVAGVGKGEKYRQDQSARDQMADSRDDKANSLGADLRNNKITQDQYDKYLEIVTDTYAKEVEAYTARTDAINAAQGDWLNGANDAWANYLAKAQDVAGQSAAAFTSAYEGMTDGVSNSIARSIVHGESLGESLRNVALGISENFIAAFIKIGIQKLITDKIGAGMYASTVAAQSQAMVAMAGLNAFAATAAIPFVGPELAPEAAMAASTAAEVYAGLATAAAGFSVLSASKGMDIPAGINPLTQLHEKEMVLPAQHADTIRRLGQSGGDSATGGGISIAPTYNIHIDGTTDMARNQQMVKSAIQQGNADLVDKLQRARMI